MILFFLQIAMAGQLTVAVIDTGTDVDHLELKDSIWTNPGESGTDWRGRNKQFNGVDDDLNGFIDDVHGWNFVDNNNDISDSHGHGTHISGIVKKSSLGNVKIMILKYYATGRSSELNLLRTIQCIQYATKMAANIINYSGGGYEYSLEEKTAIEQALQKNILYTAAAGNDRSNNDQLKFYPASYELKNILPVAALDLQKNQLVESSNYGTKTVFIAAPGKEIVSTLPFGRWGGMTGTSQATAFVSGAAALLLSLYPSLQPADVIRHLVRTGQFQPNLVQRLHFPKALDLNRMVVMKSSNITASGLISSSNFNSPNLFNSDLVFPEL